MHKAMGELQMLAQSDLERERYEARLKFQRDYTTGLDEARDAGREAGIRETWIKQIRYCEKLLQRPATPEDQLGTLSAAALERSALELADELARGPRP
jgi:hypothetical protein